MLVRIFLTIATICFMLAATAGDILAKCPADAKAKCKAEAQRRIKEAQGKWWCKQDGEDNCKRIIFEGAAMCLDACGDTEAFNRASAIIGGSSSKKATPQYNDIAGGKR